MPPLVAMFFLVMTNSVTMNAARFCSRCGKDLTDAASQECGVGPVCRKMDNKLLAKCLPANPGVAKVAWAMIDFLAQPTTVIHVLALVDVKVATMSPVDDDTFGNDWRDTVKQIEWVLSHTLTGPTVTALHDFVSALGYTGLAALWKGDAATGKAVVTFANGRLSFTGPNNKGGRTSFKAACPGYKFHAKTSTTPAAWSAPAAAHKGFYETMVTHWPNNEGLAEAVEQAKNWLSYGKPSPTLTLVPSNNLTVHKEATFTMTGTAVPWTLTDGNAAELEQALIEVGAPPFTPAKLESKCFVTVDGDTLKVVTPYCKDFVTGLKLLPYKERAWNPVAKCWTVKATRKTELLALLQTHYGETVEVA
jgi:hypothetical protein